jgi:tRNA(Ile)-lysidine synthase
MISDFTRHIQENHLFGAADKVLVAVSGGVDSMVMWQLFETAGYNYAVAHCNFRLRGADSDADEELVRRKAEERGIRLFVRSFDTQEYAAIAGISIEMAARELRYEWFGELMKQENFQALATAHHRDDLLETFFINLLRKTGIRGLTAFRPKTGHLIRPMLFTDRKSIELWAAEQGVEYRTDLTNNEIIYQRNFIRHRIIPALEELNPAFRKNLSETMGNLREVEVFYETEINRQIKRITNTEGQYPEISVSGLMKLPHPRQVLFEWMSKYGFNAAVTEQVFQQLDGESGRRYFSPGHRLVADRNRLIITPLPETPEHIFYLESGVSEIFEPVHLSMSHVEVDKTEIDPDPRVAFLDAGKLRFPLIIRKWKTGEYFQPLGMHGFKKISDFFVDQKLSIPEKEQTWILYSGDKVAWIIGHRIDNRFRITGETSEILVVRLHL